MARLRAALGIVAGIMLILSGAAHSGLGWKSLGAQLAAAAVPADLQLNLKIGWHFGGAAMLLLGTILVGLFARRLSGAVVPSFPALAIAAVYLAFGTWAILASGNPFFFDFIVPALLLVYTTPGTPTDWQQIGFEAL